MSSSDSPHDDPLSDFEHHKLTLLGETRRVLVAGQGPAIIVMPEMPGISPDVARFARWLVAAGFSVYVPSLFGRDGAYPRAEEGMAVLQRACVSAEFRALEANVSSPITRWLRALAAFAHGERGGRGVGAIGMCFTGNFALSLMLEPSTLAGVLCQPSLPFGDKAALHIAPDDLEAVRSRLERERLSVLGYRFDGDHFCTAERFEAYQRALGDRFVARVLPACAANRTPPPFFADVVRCPHSVVTAHLVDQAGEPTLAARDEIIAYFAKALGQGSDVG